MEKGDKMKKMTREQLNMVVVCPVCKREHRQGKMMCGTDKPICKYCYGGLNNGKN